MMGDVEWKRRVECEDGARKRQKLGRKGCDGKGWALRSVPLVPQTLIDCFFGAIELCDCELENKVLAHWIEEEHG